MNALLEQFLAEARDYLDEAARSLLALEQADHNEALINGIFRNFHTIKGTSGIFPEFQPITRLTHVAEDLMDQVRNRQRTLDTEAVDLLLAVLDLLSDWLCNIEETEQLPQGAANKGQELREQLLAIMVIAPEAEDAEPTAESGTDPDATARLSAWLNSLDQIWPDGLLDHDTPPVAIWYHPDPNCFFLGDDPVNLLRQLPAPLVLEMLLPEQLPQIDEFDPFTCQVSFRLVVCESVERIRNIFQYVEDQLQLAVITKELLAAAQPMVAAVTDAKTPSVTTDEQPVTAVTDKKTAATTFIRVDQRLVNQFMDLVGELLVARNSLPYLCQQANTIYQVPELAAEIDNRSNGISLIVASLQDVAMEMRMMPVARAFERFPRLVRDISNKLGKKIKLVTSGEETRSDKDIIDALSEPLIHLVRNSLDHGIEMPEERLANGKKAEGTITLSAFQEAGYIVIEIVDDGKGIDPKRIKQKALDKGIATAEALAAMSDHDLIQLILAPNFSTADEVSDLSGRGVGMDAVQTMVHSFNGIISVQSTMGSGSTVRLTLPLSMAITRLLTVRQAGCTFGIPANDLIETLADIPLTQVQTMGTAPGLKVRGELLPLYHLGTQLAMGNCHSWLKSGFSVAVVRVRGELAALVVDEFCDIIDAVMKPLSGMLAKSGFYTGSTILGDGSIMLLLNLPRVIAYAS